MGGILRKLGTQFYPGIRGGFGWSYAIAVDLIHVANL